MLTGLSFMDRLLLPTVYAVSQSPPERMWTVNVTTWLTDAMSDRLPGVPELPASRTKRKEDGETCNLVGHRGHDFLLGFGEPRGAVELGQRSKGTGVITFFDAYGHLGHTESNLGTKQI